MLKRLAISGRLAACCLISALVMALTLPTVPHATAATIAVAADRRAGVMHIEASALLNSDGPTAWHVLTDYDRYSEFIPDLRVSRVVARSGPTVTVEQSWDFALWLIRSPAYVTFAITESAPGRLESRASLGDGRFLESSYSLTTSVRGVRLAYTGRVESPFGLLWPIEELNVKRHFTRYLQGLADEIERRSAMAAEREAGDGR